MKVLGFEITRTKAPRDLRTPESRGGWYPIVREGFAGAWQRNIDTPLIDVLSHPTVFACISRIANDISKMRCELVVERANDVWEPIEVSAFSPVLRKPNHYQVPLQFFRSWCVSLQSAGNTYVLKQRDERSTVRRMDVLNPWRVKPLVSPDGSVFYHLDSDTLSGVPESPIGGVVVPASEIIHDLINPLFHSLVGIAPVYAAGIPAILGLRILTSSTHFFGAGGRPGGILTAPGAISNDTATALKTYWDTNFTGTGAGTVAVVGDGLKYEAMALSSQDSQLHEQWSAASEAIATAFGVPFYMVGGPQPNYNNVQAQTVGYYLQTIQPLTKACEDLLDDGLGLSPDKISGQRYGTQFNVNDLLWMDSATMMSVIKEGIGAGVLTPNEGRAQLNRMPVDGGDTPYLQQQYVPLSAAAENNPNQPPPQAPPQLPAADMPGDMPPDQADAALASGFEKQWATA